MESLFEMAYWDWVAEAEEVLESWGSEYYGALEGIDAYYMYRYGHTPLQAAIQARDEFDEL
jgi:hypothetical protein